jgi:hypothetical protein
VPVLYNTVTPGVIAPDDPVEYGLENDTLGPLALDPNPDMISVFVSKYCVAVKFLLNGVDTVGTKLA